MWRRGREVFAEVTAPTDAGVEVAGVGIHPVLLDAVLHAAALTTDTDTAQTTAAVLLAGGVTARRGCFAGTGPHHRTRGRR